VDLSIDPRPWRINFVPMDAFVAFTDALWPQLYWDTFKTPGNAEGYTNSGYPVTEAGITPEFLLETTARALERYNREVIPVGQGAAGDPATWPRFAHRAWDLRQPTISAWRLGVTRAETLAYLAANPPGPEPQAPLPTPTPTQSSASPTNTPKATRTPTPTNTNTPATPTNTNTPLAPTHTPTNTPAAPTSTPVPPTATSTP